MKKPRTDDPGTHTVTLTEGQVRILNELDVAIRQIHAQREIALLAIMSGKGVERFQVRGLDAQTRVLTYSVPVEPSTV